MSPAVGLIPKVIGIRSATVVTEPMPGSTPISVPTRQPTNAYRRVIGVAAMLKPVTRLGKKDSMAHPRGPAPRARARAAGRRPPPAAPPPPVGDAEGDDHEARDAVPEHHFFFLNAPAFFRMSDISAWFSARNLPKPSAMNASAQLARP